MQSRPQGTAVANQSEPEDSDNEDKDDGNWERRVGRRDQPPRGASAASSHTLVIEEAEEDCEPASGAGSDSDVHSELDSTQLDAENEDDHS